MTAKLLQHIKLEAQANRIQRDLHKQQILACLSRNAPAVMTGTSVECEECGDRWKCKQFRNAIKEVEI